MPKLSAFAIDGIDLWFWSNEHAPPHFHAARVDEWEVTVRFMLCTQEALDFKVEWGDKPRAKDLKALLGAVLHHRDALLVEWETKVLPKEVI